MNFFSTSQKLNFSIKHKKGFRISLQPRAMRLVLVRATPRAEVDVISV